MLLNCVSPPRLKLPGIVLFALVSLMLLGSTAMGQGATVTNWIINDDGTTGTSTDSAIDAFVSQILSDVSAVYFDDDYVYIQTSGVPSYNTGPFNDGNIAYPSDLDATYRISRSPTPNTSGTFDELNTGQQGILVNGVSVYSYSDGQSWNNLGIWNQDANVFEADGFDSSFGHPSPIGGGGGGPGGGGGGGGGGGEEPDPVPGLYHHHQDPIALRELLGDDGSGHSPLIGFAADGFPIYGPNGYADPNDSSSAIVQMVSGYVLRDITDRTTLADGTVLSMTEYGPTLAEYVLGSYQEDFEFDAMAGDLDVHNGRFTITPDYAQGTYAYFITLDADGVTTAFPHIIGASFFGNNSTAFDGVVIPETATLYIANAAESVPTPAALPAGLALLGLVTMRRRRRS